MPTLHLLLSTIVLIGACTPLQDKAQGEGPELTSGRPMPAEQACYDVRRYALDVRIDPERRAIQGTVKATVDILAPTKVLVFDLDQRLELQSVAADPGPAPKFQHERGEIRITFEHERPIGEELALTFTYGGIPREAPRPPWDGGFVWSKTKSGAPWIATANQMQGGDLWWPCKDQPDDEADSVSIRVTVPRPLVCASNGRLSAVAENEQERTFLWYVSTPINTYGIALNIAPYETITREYESVAGDKFPVTYWVLPENLEEGRVLFEDILRQMRVLEELYGPYPFRADKYGVAETPHLGMEHQSIIAYGNDYSGNPWGEQYGFDMLHLHEFAHEWWANLVTCANWNDFWIHEGFASYTQALYAERVLGRAAYFREMKALRRGIRNLAAVAPREKKSTAEMYFGDRAGSPGGDIYNKGAWILHSLRWLLGDEAFFRTIRRMSYPDPALERATDGSACRFATTEELRTIAERESGKELGWFFEIYLRLAGLPVLESRVAYGELQLQWKRPNSLIFPMPVEVQLGTEHVRVECPDGKGVLRIGERSDFTVDPRGWILREESGRR